MNDPYAMLSERYLAFPPEQRYEVVREIRSGERCPHGYPDQGEGCDSCAAPVEWPEPSSVKAKP